MAWRVEFSPGADKAFGKLDRQQQRRIQKFIDTRLQTDNDPHGLG
jgi:mRNA-degrading endonuclease RelE of RelBE toxin-antitoxin system